MKLLYVPTAILIASFFTALVVSHPPPAASAKPAYHAWYAGFAVAVDERYTHVDQMQLDRDRFRRRIHQSELILAQ